LEIADRLPSGGGNLTRTRLGILHRATKEFDAKVGKLGIEVLE
jgi:hypothetical protein